MQRYFIPTDSEVDGFSSYLNEIINTTNKEYDEIVLFCVGSMKVIGDSVAPKIGTEMKNLGLNVTVYGTEDEPIHALNISEYIDKVKSQHNNPLIISIDACIGTNVGKVIIGDTSLKAGSGLDKDLPEIGDLTIVCITTEYHDLLFKRYERMESVEEKLISSFVEYVTNGLKMFHVSLKGA